MKCNKCLKTIPKGEEIRFYRKKYSGGSHYGGNYCEECWKKSGHWEYFEDGGKQPSKSGSSMPGWGWVILAIMVVIILVLGFCLFAKNND